MKTAQEWQAYLVSKGIADTNDFIAILKDLEAREWEIERVRRDLAAKLTITEDEITTWNATQTRPVGFRRLPLGKRSPLDAP